MFKKIRKIIALALLVVFISASINIPIYAQIESLVRLPVPGVMVRLSPHFDPPILKGIKVHPNNPFRFDFILDKGSGSFNKNQLNQESLKLVKYFLASLTIPEEDLWVTY